LLIFFQITHRNVVNAPSKESMRYASVPMHTHPSKKTKGVQDYQVKTIASIFVQYLIHCIHYINKFVYIFSEFDS